MTEAMRDRHLADTFLQRLPPAPGPLNSVDIARIHAISEAQNGDPGNHVAPHPRIVGYDDGHIVGTARPGATVKVMSNGREAASGTADALGEFSIEVDLAINDRVFVNDGSTSNMEIIF